MARTPGRRKKRRSNLKGHSDYIDATVISPDGTLLISGGSDNTIRFWGLPDGAPRLTLAGTELVSALAISPDGRSLVSGSYRGEVDISSFTSWIYNGTLKLWNVPEGSPGNCLYDPAAVKANTLVSTYAVSGDFVSGSTCTCNSVCTCNVVTAAPGDSASASGGGTCVCNTVAVGTGTGSSGGGGGGGTYYYPN